MVGEPVQQRSGQPLRSEDLGPFVEGQVGGHQDGAPFAALAEDLEEEFSPVGDRSTKPSSSMISRLRRDRFRCRLSSGISSLASSGPLYPVFTGATPQRGYPAGVLRQHGTAGPPGLPHDRGVRRDGSGRHGWKQPCLRPRLGIPPCRSSGGGWKTRFISPWQDGILLPIPARGAAG